MNIKEKYNKLRELLNELYSEVNFNEIEYTRMRYEGNIEIPCEFTLYCVIECYLAFDNIDFSTYYTTDDIRDLCDRIENISNEVNY